MGLTPVYGFPYPSGTDSPNGPGQIQALAEAVEADLSLSDARIAALEAKSKRLIARGRLTASSAASTGAAVGVLRVNAPITTGRLYFGQAFYHPTSSITTDNIETGFKYNLAGNASAADGIMPGQRTFGLFGQVRATEVAWVATTTGTLSMALYVKRDTGSGSCTLYADATERFTEVFVWEITTDPGNTGVAL